MTFFAEFSNLAAAWLFVGPVVDFTNILMHRRPKLRAEPIVTYDHLLTHRNITMSLNFFPCKIPIPYDASYVYDACNVLVKSYSKSVVATTHGIVLVKSSNGHHSRLGASLVHLLFLMYESPAHKYKKDKFAIDLNTARGVEVKMLIISMLLFYISVFLSEEEGKSRSLKKRCKLCLL